MKWNELNELNVVKTKSKSNCNNIKNARKGKERGKLSILNRIQQEHTKKKTLKKE